MNATRDAPAQSSSTRVRAILTAHPITVRHLAQHLGCAEASALWAVRTLVQEGQAETVPPGVFPTADTRVSRVLTFASTR